MSPEEKQPSSQEESHAPAPEQPAAPVKKTIEPAPAPAISQPATPGTLILQWLTYLFWGLTILALSVLIFLVLFNLINGSDPQSAPLYTLAAIVVLLPISIVCDFLYQKREPQKKVGASAAILAIHAVIFAVFGIGVLVSGLFAVIRLVTDVGTTSQDQSNIAWVISSLIVTVLYAAVFIRTINPKAATRWLPKVHAIAMGVIITIFAVLAFTGPFADSIRTKNDRLIRSELNSLTNSVEEYVVEENKLPASLGDLTLTSENLQRIVEEDLVTIKQDPETDEEYRYQLCAVYKEEFKNSSSYSTYEARGDRYNTYISSTQPHPAGEFCYKVKINKKFLDSADTSGYVEEY